MATGNLNNDAGHRDELIVNFPGSGVWIWTDNSTWVQLHNLNATHITTGDIDGNGMADVVLDFAGYGLWTWMNNTSWVQRHSLNSNGTILANLDGDAEGRADLVVDFPGYGLWVFVNNSTWTADQPVADRRHGDGRRGCATARPTSSRASLAAASGSS